MTDIFDPIKRSEVMARIRGKNTKPERLVESYLRSKSVYFRKQYKSREGFKIDIALPSKKRAVFIDGDFWHGRTIEKLIETRGEDDFWTKKMLRNITRDVTQAKILTQNGWSIIRVWESELMKKSSRQETLDRIKEFLLQ